MTGALRLWRGLRLALALGAVGCAHLPPRNPAAVPPVVSIPLDALGAMRVVHIEIAGKGTLTLEIDTGAEITTLDAAAVQRLGLSVNEAERPFALRGIGGTRPAKWVDIPSAAIGGFALFSAPGRWATLPLDEMGWKRRVDGLLGMDVLGHFQLFFDNSRDRLELRPLGAVGPVRGVGVELPALGGASKIVVSANTSEWHFDTGANGHLVKALDDSDPPSGKERVFVGIGGKETMRWSHLPALTLGTFTLERVPVARRVQGPGEPNLLGAELLLGFDWEFDAQDAKVRLIANGRYAEPDPESWIGARLVPGGDDLRYWVFTDVAIEGPGAEAGIKAGDLLVSIDGESGVNLAPAELRRRICRNDGTSVTFEVWRRGTFLWMQLHPRLMP